MLCHWSRVKDCPTDLQRSTEAAYLRDVPQPYRFVVAAASQGCAVWAERHRVDVIGGDR